MQITETMQKKFTPAKLIHNFKFSKDYFVFEHIHEIRNKSIEFLKFNNVKKIQVYNISLALTEIISNLIKHPMKKMNYLEISFSISDDNIKMTIKDNSSSFAKFDAKCKTALILMNTEINMTESSYGLGIIIELSDYHTYVTMGDSGDRLNHFTTVYKNNNESKNTKKPYKETLINHKKKTIFLVDDEPIVLEIHENMLNKQYNVISFQKAEDALKKFNEHKPDLIISDLVMPDMDGIELRKNLSEFKNGDTTPFIFLSGNSAAKNNTYISELGIDDFLCKPIEQERLHIVVARLLKRSQQIYDSVQGNFHHDIKNLLTPSLPKSSKGWSLLTKYQIAEAGGGDFILNQETNNSSIIILADVMGHGKQAKFFAYTYAGYLRSIFRTSANNHNAAKFLQYLSKSIDGDPLLESVILTCQCFQIFPNGLINIASAGHPLPLLISNNSAKAINIMGPLPGLIGDNKYDMKSIKLNTGDKIIFMTDGFLDVFDEKGSAVTKLLEIINKNISLSKEELSKYIWEEFLKKQAIATINKDDATIIIIEYGE